MRTTEPTILTQGERMEWTRSFADYPATEYDLQYRFRGNGTGINVDAVADGDSFVAEVTAAQSATMAAVKYAWQAWLTEIADPTNTFEIESGSTDIQRGFTEGSTTAIDLRTPAKIMLDSIDAAITAFATGNGVTEYEIETPAGRRRVKRSDTATLSAERKYWAGIVANEQLKERMKNGGPFAQPIRSRMYKAR